MLENKVTELELKILNQQHILDLLGKALDEKDKRLFLMYARCAMLTNKTVCDFCYMSEHFKILLSDSRNFVGWADRVLMNLKHSKTDAKKGETSL